MAIGIANAPCSWGVLEFDGHAPTYGYGDVLDEMAASGFMGTELGDWGFMPADPAPLARELGKRPLDLVGAFVPVALADPGAHRAGVENAVRTASLMRDAGFGDAFIVLADRTEGNPGRIERAGRVNLADGLSDAQWHVVARGAIAIARAVRDSVGLRTVFHPHCGSWIETAHEIGALMDRTEPDLLGLCIDTGHLTYAGDDPLAVYERYASRVWHVHFKDCDPQVAEAARRQRLDYFAAVRSGVFCELGRGAVDFPRVVNALVRHHYRGWVVVEQDVLPALGTPLASAIRNRAYLRRLGF